LVAVLVGTSLPYLSHRLKVDIDTPIFFGKFFGFVDGQKNIYFKWF
jgi:hypothetical protein